MEPTDDWQQLALIRGMTIRETDGDDAIDLCLQMKLPLADADSAPILKQGAQYLAHASGAKVPGWECLTAPAKSACADWGRLGRPTIMSTAVVDETVLQRQRAVAYLRRR